MAAICAGRQVVAFCPIRTAAFPIAAIIGEPGADGYKLEQFAVGYAFEHRFDNNLQFRQNFRYFDVSNDLASVRSEGMLPDFRTACCAPYQLCERRRAATSRSTISCRPTFVTGRWSTRFSPASITSISRPTPTIGQRSSRRSTPIARSMAPAFRRSHAGPVHPPRRQADAGRRLPAGSDQARSMDANAHRSTGLGEHGLHQQGLLPAGRHLSLR